MSVGARGRARAVSGASRPLRRRGRQGGFTLIELLVVIVILGILSAVVVFAIRGSGDKGKAAAIQTDERTIRTAMEVFCARNDRYPGGPGVWEDDPMGELVDGKYLSNPSTLHKLTTGNGDSARAADDPFPEGKCTRSPTNYLLEDLLGPDDPPPQPDYIAVAAGSNHSLRLTNEGKVFAVGENTSGQLGDGTRTEDVGCMCDRQRPFQVEIEGVNAVEAGQRFSLAVKAPDDTVWAWGRDLGLVNNIKHSLKPAQVKEGENGSRNLDNVADISTAGNGSHALALKKDEAKTVWAWGSNNVGQLGDGTVTDRSTAVPVLGGVSTIAAGLNHSLAVKGGAVWAWGSNANGQLGASPVTSSRTPVMVAGLDGIPFSPVIKVAAGDTHSVALKADRTVWVWGLPPGGSGTTVPVEILDGVTAIDSGAGHVLALKDDGPEKPGDTVWAWGSNAKGQLGNANQDNRTQPEQVKGFGGVVPPLNGANALSAGSAFSMAAMDDGRVLVWGDNQHGQFGIGHWDNSSVPTGLGAGPPANDDFANRRVLTTPPAASPLFVVRGGLDRGHNISATNEGEGEEPDHMPGENLSAGKSVWYEWIAPNDFEGLATFTTGYFGDSSVPFSNFNTTISVYTSTDPLNPSVSTLDLVAQNDDVDDPNPDRDHKWSQVKKLPSAPGVVYYIAIDGSDSGTNAFIKLQGDIKHEGGIRLSWRIARPPGDSTPPYDCMPPGPYCDFT